MKLLKLVSSLLGLALVPMLSAVSPTMSQEVLKPIAPKFTPDPQVYFGNAGGDFSLASIATSKVNGQCQGFTQQMPNHTLIVRKDFGFLALKVVADRDLSLLVKGPDGIYCRNGKAPELSGAWIEGKYEIWVGTVDGNRIDYRLTASETSQ
jgi:hypothetical protein